MDLKFSRKGFDFGVSVTGEDFSEMVRRYEVLNADLLKDIEEKERKEEERIAREKERKIQEAELASRRKKEAAQKLEAEKRRAEQEKVAAKEKKERERVARIEKANSIKACEDGNRKRLGELHASVENQKSRLLNNSEALTFFCDSYYNSYQTVVCKRWGISLDNRSMYPIKAIKVGFDEYRVCADDPAKTFTLDMDVSAFGKSKVKYVEWYGDIQKWEYTFWGGKWVETPVCTKLLAVDYKVGFQPVSCK